MSEKPPSRMAPGSKTPSEESEAGPADAARGSLRWAKGLLTRSIGIEKRQNQLHVVLVDKNRAEPAKPLLQRMRDEIGSRLLVHDPSTQAVRNLYLVHQELSGTGWAGVEALPKQVRARGLAEAEMLQSEEPSELLEMIIAKLAEVNTAADARAELESILRDEEWEAPAVPEISETSYDEYELMERSWVGTVPSGLRPDSEL